jgi:hypothetical protein
MSAPAGRDRSLEVTSDAVCAYMTTFERVDGYTYIRVPGRGLERLHHVLLGVLRQRRVVDEPPGEQLGVVRLEHVLVEEVPQRCHDIRKHSACHVCKITAFCVCFREKKCVYVCIVVYMCVGLNLCPCEYV